jgi:hypothetical protein
MALRPGIRERLSPRRSWEQQPYLDAEYRPALQQRFKAFNAWTKSLTKYDDGHLFECNVIGYRAGGRFRGEAADYAVRFNAAIGAFVCDPAHDSDRIPILFRHGAKQPKENFPFRLRRGAVFHKTYHDWSGQPTRETYVVADEWERADALEAYVDLDWKPGALAKQIHDALSGLTPLETNTLVLGTMGSQAYESKGGGVAVAAATTPMGARSAKDFFADYELIHPPSMRLDRPRAVTRESEVVNGVALKMTTFVAPSNHDFSHPQVDGVPGFAATVQAARNATGEHTVYSGILQRGGSNRQSVAQLVHSSQTTDLLYPYDLADNLPTVDLNDLLVDVDERTYAVLAATKLRPMDADILDHQLGASLTRVQSSFRASLETYVGKLPQGYKRRRRSHAVHRRSGHRARCPRLCAQPRLPQSRISRHGGRREAIHAGLRGAHRTSRSPPRNLEGRGAD